MNIESSLTYNYERLSSGQRINRAADDAAGLTIAQKMETQIRGLDRGTDNALDANNLAQTAEGALGSIHDSLQRMRELAVQASNGILADSDKAIIQDEINQLKYSIQDTVKYTEFNTQKLLDGTFSNKNLATSPSGTGSTMTIENTGLETLGIKNFDVTGDFNIEDIDQAIEMVSSSRGKLGATSNALMHTVNYNNISLYNQTKSKSSLEDLDIAKEVTNQKTNEILLQYQIYAQKQQQTIQGQFLNFML